MEEEIWIDGFNLFYRWKRTQNMFRQGADIATAPEQALKLLAHALGKRRARVSVFMDGGWSREGADRYGLRVRYAGPGGKADAILVEAAQGLGARAQRVAVVTDDLELGGSLRLLGVIVTKLRDFIPRLTGSGPSASDSPEEAHKQRQPSRHEVDAWLEVFKGNKDDEHG